MPHLPRLTRLVAALTLVSFTSISFAQALPPAETEQSAPAEEVQGKFIWGLLLKLAAPYVFDFFSSWVKKKIVTSLDDGSLEKMAANTSLASIVVLAKYLVARDIVLGGVGAAGVAPNAALGEPETPLTTGKNGENFQGVNIALVGVDADGKPTGYHTIADGFTTGDRFKLRVLSTFDAVVVLGNINPRGVSRQIYPASTGEAVSIPAGKDVLLPLGAGEYLQFAGDVGRDQLTFTVRDPRSLASGQAATTRVFRKDESFGSNFVQEVKPGAYPVIAEAIGIEHR